MRRLVAILLVVAGLSAFSASPVSAATDCKAYNKSTLYVVCVDESAQVGSVRSASNGKIGPKVIGTFTVTTSRVDDDGPASNDDTITRKGQFLLYNSQETTSDGLKLYHQFGSGEQGIHAYWPVGPGYDSHGCVRVVKKIAKRIWNLLVAGTQGNLVEAGLVEIHIYL